MSKKANPAVVGAFTLGALVLLVAAVLLFGADRFRRTGIECVLHFSGSVAGLDVGAPVVLRGVKIGTVQSIALQYDAAADEFRIPVVIELHAGAAQHLQARRMSKTNWLEHLVRRGLRAQLHSQSFLTGKKEIMFGFWPEVEPRFVQDSSGLPQIPTIAPPLEALVDKLGELPLEEIVRDAHQTVQSLARLLGSPEAQATAGNLNDLLAQAKTMVQKIQAEFPGMAASLRETSAATQKSLAVASEALKQIEALLDSESPTRYQWMRLLDSLRDAMDNVSALVESLEQQPESLLRGRKQKERY